MSQPKEFHSTIRIPMYEYDVHIIITDSIGQSRKARDKEVGHAYDAAAFVGGLHSYREGDGQSFIFLYPKTAPIVYVHEVYHVVCTIFRYIGAGPVDEEVFAYHLAWLSGEVEKLIYAKGTYRVIPKPTKNKIP